MIFSTTGTIMDLTLSKAEETLLSDLCMNRECSNGISLNEIMIDTDKLVAIGLMYIKGNLLDVNPFALYSYLKQVKGYTLPEHLPDIILILQGRYSPDGCLDPNEPLVDMLNFIEKSDLYNNFNGFSTEFMLNVTNMFRNLTTSGPEGQPKFDRKVLNKEFTQALIQELERGSADMEFIID